MIRLTENMTVDCPKERLIYKGRSMDMNEALSIKYAVDFMLTANYMLEAGYFVEDVDEEVVRLVVSDVRRIMNDKDIPEGDAIEEVMDWYYENKPEYRKFLA